MRAKHILTAAFLLFSAIIFQFFAINKACASAPLKINGLKFDNSDAVVLVESSGSIALPPKEETQSAQTTTENSYNEISKGYLSNPSRAYVDITNAVLAGHSRTYEIKNSILKTAKISQFSLNPNVVRIVFTYDNENINTKNFNVISNNKAIVIRYSAPLSSKLNHEAKNKIVYSNTEDSERIVFFENTYAYDISGDIQPAAVKNNSIMTSKFYISSLSRAQNGIMIKGTGFLSLKPAFYLDNPSRMVIDLDDTVLAPNLRNKTVSIYETGTDTGETLRLGQNLTNVSRLVIQGADAKNYRAVISPDLQNIFIAKRSDVINSKITETESIVKSISYSKNELKDTADLAVETLEFHFTNPATLSVFEENKNLYLDFNNVSGMQEGVFDSLLKLYPKASTVKIALDKLRVVLPLDDKAYNVQVKVSPDSKTLQAVIKSGERTPVETVEEPDKKESVISKLITKEQSISNLYKVVIDAGHGGSDVGATRDGIYEKNITLSIAKMVEKNLANKGVKTTMTLEKDKTVSLQERCDISNDERPDLFVSVHVNSSVNDAIYGVETHWWKEDSRQYASTVHKHLSKNFAKWKTKDRGLFQSRFYVINHTEAPAILIEIGFISNKDEREAIITQKRQAEIAKAISDGVLDYLKNKGKAK